jgi:hypothetical protein
MCQILRKVQGTSLSSVLGNVVGSPAGGDGEESEEGRLEIPLPFWRVSVIPQKRKTCCKTRMRTTSTMFVSDSQ